MNLLNRYLQAVGQLLPKVRRDDIVAELRANLLSEIEDKGEALGRPLTEDEQAAILHRYGNPTLVAGRYREPNLGLAFGVQLIGPELFPIYRTVLGIILGVTLCVLTAVTFVVATATKEQITLGRMLAPLPIQFFVTTLIFILIDRGKNHILNRWDPRQLPAVKQDQQEGPTKRNIFNFICLAVGTAWIAMTPRWPYLMLGPGALYLPALDLKLMPQWPLFYWMIVAQMLAGLTLQFFRVFRRFPQHRFRIGNLILRGIGIATGVALLLKAPNYVTSSHPQVALWANLNFEICIAVWMAIELWQSGRLLLTLIRESHQMLPARQY